MKYEIKITDRAREITAGMGLYELLNQIVCDDNGADSWAGLGPYGAMFFHSSAKDVLEKKIELCRSICPVPPLIVADFENGPGQQIAEATKFPEMLGCSVAGSEELAYEMGRCAALEGGALGYNWTLSPCIDVLDMIESPMVSIRSAGRDPERIIRIAGAYVRGLQENGMIATLKHFPGDGHDIYDQHLTTPVNRQSREEWWKGAGRIYKELIEQGVMAIMPGHIALPAFDDSDCGVGIPPPATLSKKLMTGLLKEELGFDGLIISDAINMGGFTNYMPYYEGAAQFLEAGGDMLLFVHINDMFRTEMARLIDEGKLKVETLRNRVERIISLKEQWGLFDRTTAATPKVEPDLFADAARKMVDGCVRVVRDRNNTLPQHIEKDSKVVHMIITNDIRGEAKICQTFTEKIREYSDDVTEIVNPGLNGGFFREVHAGVYDLIICSIGNRTNWGTNILRIHDNVARSMMSGWAKLGTPTVFVSHFHPYVHLEYQAAMDTVINTYGSVDYSFERILKGITGEVELPADDFAGG